MQCHETFPIWDLSNCRQSVVDLWLSGFEKQNPAQCCTGSVGTKEHYSIFRYWRLLGTPCHLSASAGRGRWRVIDGHFFESSAFNALNSSWPAGTSSSWKIAYSGHSGTQTAQSMHSSGSITRKLGPTRKQSTGQTATQAVSVQLMHGSHTTWATVISPMKFQS